MSEYFPGLAGLHPPPMYRVVQRFARPRLDDVEAMVDAQLARSDVAAALAGRRRTALAVGSRGIAGIEGIVRATVRALRRTGREVFVVPAMGSHGGATAAGQEQVLSHLGVSEDTVGAPVRSSMDTVVVGSVLSPLGGDVPLYMDALARREADAVIPINRIKPHTGFRGPVESGLCKMLVIGLGKHVGAARMHREGYGAFDRLMVEGARAVLADGHVPCGIAVVENAYGEAALLEAVPADGLVSREQELLAAARRLMPRVLLPDVDVLVVERFGKDISGIGMDANVTGRGETGAALPGFDGPRIARIVVLNLTEGSDGNAHGIGLADVITERFLGDVDHRSTWINSVTSGSLACGRIPPALPDDDQAIMAAAGAVPGVAAAGARMVRIRDTLHLFEIAVSANLVDAAAAIEECAVQGVWDGRWHLE